MVQTRSAAKRRKAAIVDSTIGNNDVLLGVAPYLRCSELVNLALVCRRFGSRLLGSNDCSLVEDVARQIITKTQTAEERAVLPIYADESWISMLHELNLLRSPLEFDQLVGNHITYVRGDKSCVHVSQPEDDYKPAAAMCSNHVMRSGKHYATFALTGNGGYFLMIGVTRPFKGLDRFIARDSLVWGTSFLQFYNTGRSSRWGPDEGSEIVDCCNYLTSSGKCICFNFVEENDFGDRAWNGREGFEGEDGEFGMLLDLDEGTLAVYRNGRRLGVMKDGLTGEYCWVITMLSGVSTNPDDDNIRIQRSRVPDS